MKRFVIVELENGDQEFFDAAYDGFKFAKQQEEQQKNSVEYVSIGEWSTPYDGVVYQGQELRNTIRMLDDIKQWLKTAVESNVDRV